MLQNLLPTILIAAGIFCSLAGRAYSAAQEWPKKSQNRDAKITHGPILGRLSHDSVGVWIRTSRPAFFRAICRVGVTLMASSRIAETRLNHDNTGWVLVSGLKPDTNYTYEVELDTGEWIKGGTFTTLPHSEQMRSTQNPQGLFNFCFEFGCGNRQFVGAIGPGLPGFRTMYEKLKGRLDFQIMNGDWLYEELRTTPVDYWQEKNGVEGEKLPDVVQIAPTIVGVWENYKLYLSRGKNLANWHRNVPTFFVFDDHEMINDINGTNDPGFRDRKTVFRDIGLQAWRDYVGWSNPTLRSQSQDILFGRADLTAGEDVLIDRETDFTGFDLKKASTLMVHWGTPDAGVWDDKIDDKKGGHPAAGVYRIEEVLDANRLRISPRPKADARKVSYSIGTKHFFKLQVGNCDFFVLDCRSERQIHNKNDPWKKGISMIGEAQNSWLKEEMEKSQADFLFVVSSVNFTIPHVGPGPPGKDEAWTAYMNEREDLIEFWDSLNKPVMVLTGDLHNSFVIKITDRIWEFASGPHNSGNHILENEGNRPPTGDFEYNGRKVNIRWSTFFPNDVLRPRMSVFCTVEVNNVVNIPVTPGETRWVVYPQPYVVLKYYNGVTGELLYAESVTAIRTDKEKSAPSQKISSNQVLPYPLSHAFPTNSAR